ncbi:MAG: zinc ribbon domain-containing protein [Treponema sp.]|jgi:putative FmdB family regulatory protein|nr:zinc ribbon domain-containing protein [Treponema sp.]
MPTYEYECKSCGHTFEAFQSMRDEPIKICPQCGREVRRLINGGSGIIFKGSGFYVTDKGKGAAKPGEKTPPAVPGKTPAAPAKSAETVSGNTAATGGSGKSTEKKASGA